MPEAAAVRRSLTMPCDIETRRNTTERKQAWHDDCPDPAGCGCPAHEHDEPAH
jgi:hypothetical protein